MIIKQIIRQFICEHKNCIPYKVIKKVIIFFKEDECDTHYPEETIISGIKYYKCKDCGKIIRLKII